jgi:hypothetical protein
MWAFHDVLQAGKQEIVQPPYSPDLVPAGARSGECGEKPYKKIGFMEP